MRKTGQKKEKKEEKERRREGRRRKKSGVLKMDTLRTLSFFKDLMSIKCLVYSVLKIVIENQGVIFLVITGTRTLY